MTGLQGWNTKSVPSPEPTSPMMSKTIILICSHPKRFPFGGSWVGGVATGGKGDGAAGAIFDEDCACASGNGPGTESAPGTSRVSGKDGSALEDGTVV